MQEPVIPAEWRRRVLADVAASARPEAEERAELARAFWSGWAGAVPERRRRKAADDLAALTDEPGLCDDRREPPCLPR